jgi:hypothetical protein
MDKVQKPSDSKRNFKITNYDEQPELNAEHPHNIVQRSEVHYETWMVYSMREN